MVTLLELIQSRCTPNVVATVSNEMRPRQMVYTGSSKVTSQNRSLDGRTGTESSSASLDLVSSFQSCLRQRLRDWYHQTGKSISSLLKRRDQINPGIQRCKARECTGMHTGHAKKSETHLFTAKTTINFWKLLHQNHYTFWL